MSQEQAKQFIEEATQSIQGGQFGKALELIDQAIALEPGNSESHVLRGIALSQTSRPQEAADAFRKAISLSPYNAKAYFNLAVHLYGMGQKVEALEMAREAAKIDVGHSGARELIARIEGESETPAEAGMPSSDPQEVPPMAGMAPPPGAAPAYRTGYDLEPAHSVALVEKLGDKWTTVGWMLVVLGLVLFGIGLAYRLPLLSQMSDFSKLMETMQQMQGSQPPIMTLVGILDLISRVALLVWVIMDILDRRGQWLWVAPVFLCCCCELGWLVAIIYLLAGRK